MREKIDRFSKGIFQLHRPALQVSEELLSWSVTQGEDCTGSFRIASEDGSRITAFLLCDDVDMMLDCPSFEKEEKEIHYRYRTKRMSVGQKKTGEIRIISSLGEVCLPYEIWVTEPVCESSIGPLSDLYQFEGLARENWEEARELFFSEAFTNIILKNKKEVLLYRGLCRSSSADQAMEEFLRTVRKKAPVQLQLEKTEVEYHLAGKAMKDTIRIQKIGWGLVNVRLRVESVGGAFLQLEKDHLDGHDFAADSCELAIVLDPEALTGEKSTALIWLETPDQTLRLQVTLYGVARGRRRGAAVSKRKNYERRLMENYLQYRQGKLSQEEYESGRRAILYGLQVLGEPSDWLAEEALTWPQNWIAEKTRPVTGMGWEARERRPEERIRECREWFAEGRRSPLLYQEAWLAFREAPELLVRLEEFEVQMMNWARKRDLWEDSLTSRYVYLTESSLMFVRADQKLVFYYLQDAYGQHPDPETLNALCLWLLRRRSQGARQTKEIHEWYRKGVEQGLRLTGLYEAYIETLELVAGADWGVTENVLPDSRVYTYFMRDNRLSSQKKANFYAHIIRQKEKRPAVYQNYREQMRELAVRQLAAGECSEALAVIYEDLLRQSDFRALVMKDLPKVLFDTRIRCQIPGIRGLWIWHVQEEEEVFVPMEQGCATVELYTEDACILLEDERGYRWSVSLAYECKPLLDARSWLESCYEAGSRERRLLLALTARTLQSRDANRAVRLLQEMLEQKGLSSLFRQEVLAALIHCCQEQKEEELLEQYLIKYDLRRAGIEERIALLDQMLLREMWEPAEAAIRLYGYVGLDRKQLLRLVSHRVEEGAEPEAFLLSLCWYLLEKGLHERNQLAYLTAYYEGGLEQLCLLWQTLRSFGLPTGSLEERIVEQMLFTEGSVDPSQMIAVYLAFREKVDREHRGDARKLLRAFLAYWAYRYLTVDQPVQEELIQHMKEEVFYDDTLLCKVAVLKYYSEKPVLTAQEKEFAEHQMEQLAVQGRILPFFRQFAGKCRIPAGIRHQQFAVYVGEPGGTAEIHYRILDREESSWQSESMPEVFYGIHVKGFVLFYGERVQYQVADQALQEIVYTPSGEETEREPEDTYELLNRIRMAREVGDITAQIQLMEQYLRQEQMKEILFQPMGLK